MLFFLAAFVGQVEDLFYNKSRVYRVCKGEKNMIYVLMNPKANNGLGERDAREWAKCLSENPTFINVLEKKDMKEFLSTLDEKDEIVVAGGDGTIHNFIKRLSGYK